MTHLAHLARPRRRGALVAFGALGALGVPLSTPGISVALGATGAPRALGAPVALGALGALGAWRASRACRTWRAFRTWRTGRTWRMTSCGAPGARPMPPRATGPSSRGGAPRFTARLHCRSARLRRCVNWLNEQGGALLTICINQDDRAKDAIELKGAKTKW